MPVYPPSTWFAYYMLRLHDTLKTCPYAPFLYLYPFVTLANPIRCLVYADKRPLVYDGRQSSTCVHNSNEAGDRLVQRLHQTIYEIASQKTTAVPATPPHAPHTARIQFEDNTIVNIWRMRSSQTNPNTKNRLLVSVYLQVDKSSPPLPTTSFDSLKQCKGYVAYVEQKQSDQYKSGTPHTPVYATNPRFANIPVDQWFSTPVRSPIRMVYDQPDYTAGDWGDLWLRALYTSYTEMQQPNTQSRAKIRPRVKEVMHHIEARFLGRDTPYTNLSPETTLNTLYYVFQKQQKGIFVRIKNNTLHTFLPFVRQNFTNDYYTALHLPEETEPRDKTDLKQLREYEVQLSEWDDLIQTGDPEQCVHLKQAYAETLESFLQLEYDCAKRFSKYFVPRYERNALQKNPNRRNWLANNHFFNSSLYYANPNVHHFKYLFEQLVQHRKQLPDMEFVYMPRDYPVLKATHTQNTTTIHHPFADVQREHTQNSSSSSSSTSSEPGPAWFTCKGGLMPILSHTGKEGYYDIPLPTVDDIEHYSQLYFPSNCNASYISETPQDKWVEWKDKTVSKAVFRGSATGRGVDETANQRLHLMKLSKDHPALLDVKVVGFNDKYKTHAHADGLQMIQHKGIQSVVGPISKQKNYMEYAERKSYKYNLCLDGHTRADRFVNELCTGAVVILPTTDGHYLWVEPFLKPFRWEDICRTEHTPQSVRDEGYTHITISQLDEIPQLIQWMQSNDAICEAIATNTKQWLFGKKGYYLRETPHSSFLYDYVEGVLRSLAKQTHSGTYTLPLYGAGAGAGVTNRIQTAKTKTNTNTNTNTKTSKRTHTIVSTTKRVEPKTKIKTKTKKQGNLIVGIVVGFRDSEHCPEPGKPNRVRTHQLQQFCAYWNQLAPSDFRYTIVIAEQVTHPQDERDFGSWWATHVEAHRTDTVGGVPISVFNYIQLLEAHSKTNTLPDCVRRNLALVHNDCYLACGVMRGKHADIQNAKQTLWSASESFRRTGEQKFNLGALKNAGYAHLKDTYGAQLSHVVFTDIDMLPDHQLAPYYAQQPRPNEIIALATRGTVYDHFSVDNMPIYTLMQHPMHQTNHTHQVQRHTQQQQPHPHTQPSLHKTHKTHKTHGGKRHHKPYVKKSFTHQRQNTHRHNNHNNHHTHTVRSQPAVRYSPTTQDGRKCVQSWMRYKFDRFVGASISFSTTLFETINGYPNSFWGWGGEDDELRHRFRWAEELELCARVQFTVPPGGRLIDLELAQPVTIKDKLAFRVKELHKNEKLAVSQTHWQTDGLHQIRAVCESTHSGLFQKFPNTEVLKVVL